MSQEKPWIILENVALIRVRLAGLEPDPSSPVKGLLTVSAMH